MRLICLAFALSTTAFTAQADPSIQRFSLYVSGIKAGSVQTVISTSGTAFSVSGQLSPTRFLRSIRNVGYTGQSAGTVKDGVFSPKRYSGQTQTGSRNSQVQMRFQNGRPSVDSYTPVRETRPYDITPSKQTGTIDPLTAAAQVFQDQTASTLCNTTLHMFDGRRRSKLTLSAPKREGPTATCQGTYTRVAGFSPNDMKERVNFPFSLVYTRTDADTYRLTSFSTKTTFGSLRAKRK